jgi:hypothetical protein
MGQVLEVDAERKDRLQAHGDFTVAPEQQLSDIWHKALRNPAEISTSETSMKSIKYEFYSKYVFINNCFIILDILCMNCIVEYYKINLFSKFYIAL